MYILQILKQQTGLKSMHHRIHILALQNVQDQAESNSGEYKDHFGLEQQCSHQQQQQLF